jgi:hypothetical protein
MILDFPPRRNVMANKNEYTSNERLYLDKDDNVVKADDPNRLTLLVAAGSTLPMEKAEKYGLTKPAAEGEAPIEGEESAEFEIIPEKTAAPKKAAPAKTGARKK